MPNLKQPEPVSNPQQLWQQQPVEGVQMSAAAIRLRAGKFERRISRRNLREYVISVLVIAGFSYFFITTPGILPRITWALFIAGMIFIMIQLYLKGTPRKLPAEVGQASSIDFFRNELVRQRDLVKDVWPWYLAPLVPGYIALNVQMAVKVSRPSMWLTIAALDAVFVALFYGVWRMNMRAARCLDRMITDLPSADERTDSHASRS